MELTSPNYKYRPIPKRLDNLTSRLEDLNQTENSLRPA